MRVRWFLTPLFYALGLILGVVGIDVYNYLLTSDSRILDASIISTTLYLGLLFPPLLLLWLLLTLANYWLEKRSQLLAVLMPLLAGVLIVIYGYFIVLPALLRGLVA